MFVKSGYPIVQPYVSEKTSATRKLTVQKTHRNLRALHIVTRGEIAWEGKVRARVC